MWGVIEGSGLEIKLAEVEFELARARLELVRETQAKQELKAGLRLAQRTVRRKVLFLTLVFVLPLMTGLTIALNRMPEIGSALASFFVSDPLKGVDIDRGYYADETSQLNVFDDEAEDGYLIKARVSSAIDPNFTVRIWAAGTICTLTNPCTLSTVDRPIYFNSTDSATQDNTGTGGTKGDVLDFNVRILSSLALSAGIHDVDIIYTKERLGKYLQTFDTGTCDAMPVHYPVNNPPAGSEIKLTDMRDGKLYTIRKLPKDNQGLTGWCWMVDNLALQPEQLTPMVLDELSSDVNYHGLSPGLTYTLSYANVANLNTGSYCSGLSTSTYLHKCGMSYSWSTAVLGENISTGSAVNSICPKNWRLPVDNEYAILQTGLAWGNNGPLVADVNGFRGLLVGWAGANHVPNNQGANGYYWLATTVTGTPGSATILAFSTGVGSGSVLTASTLTKTNHISVRCLAR